MENGKSEQLMIKGAFLLAVSSGIVKVLSAVYKVPLYRIVGDSVMGYYNTAFQIYTTLLTLATAGLPIAMSRMVATANAVGRRNEPKRLFVIALLAYGGFSLLVSAGMFCFSDYIAYFLKNPGASLAVKAISPAIFFVTIGASIKGYYQGNQNMLPTSIANVTEAAVKLAAGFSLAAVFSALYPGQSEIIAAGTILCAACSSLSALLYLIILTVYKITKRKKAHVFADQTCVPSMPYGKLARSFFAISIPIMIGSLTTTLSGMVDNEMILGRFQAIGFSAEEANSIWGAYSTMGNTIYMLPTFIITAISASLIPAVSTHFAQQDKEMVKADINLAGRICGIVVFPIATVIAVMPKEILRFLFDESEYLDQVSGALVILCVAMISLAFTNCFTGMLQSVNKQMIPVINIIISLIIKSVAAYVLLGIPGVGLYGAALSTLISMTVMFILNAMSVKQNTGTFPSVVSCFIKPFICSAVGAAAAFVSWRIYRSITGIEYSGLMTVVAVLIAIVFYLIMLLITGTITKNDIGLLSKSNKN